MTHTCPSCGYDLAGDAVVVAGPWRIVPRDAAYYNGKRISVRPSWLNIMMTLAREEGRTITSDALLNRVSDSEDTNVIASQISQLRQTLNKIGIPTPIACGRGRGAHGGGYYWKV